MGLFKGQLPVLEGRIPSLRWAKEKEGGPVDNIVYVTKSVANVPSRVQGNVRV
jgi:hypothetical protein